MSIIIPSLQGIVFVPSLWTPEELANLVAWFDAADADTITLNGPNVSQWDDKSENDNNIVQSSEAQQPEYDSINKKLVFNPHEFLSKNQQNNMFAADGTCSVFYVGDFDTSLTDSDPFMMLNVNTNSGADRLLPSIKPVGKYGGRLSVTYRNYSDPFFSYTIDDEKFLLEGIAGLDNKQKLYLNGLYKTYADITLNTNTTPNYFNLGDTWNSIEVGGKYSIFEYVHFTKTLSDSDRQKIEGYLAHKWNIASKLPVGHPYKLNPPYKN